MLRPVVELCWHAGERRQLAVEQHAHYQSAVLLHGGFHHVDAVPVGCDVQYKNAVLMLGVGAVHDVSDDRYSPHPRQGVQTYFIGNTRATVQRLREVHTAATAHHTSAISSAKSIVGLKLRSKRREKLTSWLGVS